MVDIGQVARSKAEDVKRFFDFWNIVGFGGVVLFTLLATRYWGVSPESVLVSVTALYAFIAFNQMREARWKRSPNSLLAVRPHFLETDSGSCDFGLQNFGDSPALNLRLIAVLREGDAIHNTLSVSSRDRHLNLEEDGFLSLISEAPGDHAFNNLTDAEAPVFENYGEKYIELYYTYESNQGVQHPRQWNRPMDMKMEDVMEKSDSPRTVELAEIRDKCT